MFSTPKAFSRKAGQAKNRKGARQSISAGLAAELRDFATGEPAGPRIDLPKQWKMVTVIRADFEAARALWLADANCPDERMSREGSDFLKLKTSASLLDFQSLRHSTGYWLARSDVAPHIVQKVMRHSTFVLTFYPYGQLFEDALQEAASKLVATVGVSSRPVERLSVTKNVTKAALESRLDASAVKSPSKGGHTEYPEINGGSAWESNPPTPCFPCGSTVLKTAPGTSPGSASEFGKPLGYSKSACSRPIRHAPNPVRGQSGTRPIRHGREDLKP